MPTSREDSSSEVGVASRAGEAACGQAPVMEEGKGVTPRCPAGCSVLYSASLRALVGGECLQILRCGICMEFFNIPIVLPCGHTFCLQCLTEMCKHATRPHCPSPVLTEVLIGCPNCRVQIFATPILQRNVTCNFIIQSLVDMLRVRTLPQMVEVSVNTERCMLGPPVRAVTEEACEVLRDLDRLSVSLQRRSVLDDAFFEIDNIRRLHLAHVQQAAGDSVKARSDPGWVGATKEPVSVAPNLPAPALLTANRRLAPAVVTFPPSAIAATAAPVSRPGEQSSRPLRQGSSSLAAGASNPASPRRCYAAALVRSRDKAPATAGPPSVHITHGSCFNPSSVRSHRPLAGASSRTLPPSSSTTPSASIVTSSSLSTSSSAAAGAAYGSRPAAQTSYPTLTQNSPNVGFRNKNRNNSKLSPEMSLTPPDSSVTTQDEDGGRCCRCRRGLGLPSRAPPCSQQAQERRGRTPPGPESARRAGRGGPKQEDWELMTGSRYGAPQGSRTGRGVSKAGHGSDRQEHPVADPPSFHGLPRGGRPTRLLGVVCCSDVSSTGKRNTSAGLVDLLVHMDGGKILGAKFLVRLREKGLSVSGDQDLLLVVRLRPYVCPGTTSG